MANTSEVQAFVDAVATLAAHKARAYSDASNHLTQSELGEYQHRLDIWERDAVDRIARIIAEPTSATATIQ